jgi:hypothetical protein
VPPQAVSGVVAPWTSHTSRALLVQQRVVGRGVAAGIGIAGLPEQLGHSGAAVPDAAGHPARQQPTPGTGAAAQPVRRHTTEGRDPGRRSRSSAAPRSAGGRSNEHRTRPASASLAYRGQLGQRQRRVSSRVAPARRAVWASAIDTSAATSAGRWQPSSHGHRTRR